ncbi:MAG: type VI secretion system protein TssA [Maioricimonas sp. JB045]
MSSATVIEFDDLLAPISEETPAGEDIRQDFSPQSLYFSIKDAQSLARTEERKRRDAFDEDPDASFRPEDWNPVLVYAEQILVEKSKDLEVAAWYVEALLRHHGFAGLRDGFRLLRELIDRYWEDIFPRPDEDGLVTTVAPITSLNGEDSAGTLIWPISNIPLTSAESWGCWQYQQAQRLQGLDPQELEERIEEGAVTLDMFDKAVSSTPPDYFRELVGDIEAALDELKQLTDLMDERCGVDDSGYPVAPSTRNIEQALEEALATVRTATTGIDIAPAAEAPPEEVGAEGDGEEGTTAAAGGAAAAAPTGAAAPVVSGGMTREQAYRAVQDLAEYFKKNEPHSPTAYLLEKAVRWGRMPLPRLLNELIVDQPTLSELFRLMGLEESEDGPQM